MAEQRIVIGGEEPLFGAVLGAADQQFTTSSDGRPMYVASLVTEGADGQVGVGLDILLSGWEKRPLSDEEIVPFYDGDMRFRSLGEPTRRLGREWSGLLLQPYRVPSTPLGKLLVDAVAFEDDPINMASNGLKAKCWFGDADEIPQCEVFMRVDAANKTAWFGEKSADDTAGFIQWLVRLG